MCHLLQHFTGITTQFIFGRQTIEKKTFCVYDWISVIDQNVIQSQYFNWNNFYDSILISSIKKNISTVFSLILYICVFMNFVTIQKKNHPQSFFNAKECIYCDN